MVQVISGVFGFVAGWVLGSRRIRAVEPGKPDEIESDIQAPPDPLLEELSEVSASADALRESVAALDKQLGRVGREQFKVNTLSETQQKQVQLALDQLRDLNARRESDITLLREQLRADQSAQRLLTVQRILPALDGLDEAIASGERLLARQPRPQVGTPPALSMQQRMSRAWQELNRRTEVSEAPAADFEEWRSASAAWLAGIELVRQRLLQVLAGEGVHPMHVRGELFDPHRHIAVEVIPAADGQMAGKVMSEHRQGYEVGDRVLRAAEVVVAKEGDNDD